MKKLKDEKTNFSHDKMINKYFPNGFELIVPNNPTFEENETYEFFKKNEINKLK